MTWNGYAPFQSCDSRTTKKFPGKVLVLRDKRCGQVGGEETFGIWRIFFFSRSHPAIEPGGRPGIAATTSYSAQEVAAQSSAGGPLFGHPQSHSPRGTPPLGPARHRQSRVCVRNCWSTSQVCLWTKQLRDHLTTTVKTHSRSHQSRAITVLSASGFSGYSIPARGHFDLFAASPRFQVFS